MKHKIYVLVLLLQITAMSMSELAVAETQKSKYFFYISNPYLIEDSQDNEASLAKEKDNPLALGIVYFRNALLNSDDEEKVGSAFEYWQDLYEQDEFHNPLVLAYVGTLESMYAGSLDRGVIKKTNLVKSGTAKLTEAVDQILEEDDSLAQYYVYYLRGETNVNLPTFFKEFKKQVDGNIEESLDAIKRAKKTGLYEDSVLDIAYANAYKSYGRWYEKKEEYKKALKYYEKAKEKSQGSPVRLTEIDEIIRELKKNL